METRTLSDTTLAAMIGSGLSPDNAIEELAGRYGGLCQRIFKRYGISGLCLGNVDGEKYGWVWRAAMTFLPEGGASFATWLSWKVKSACRNASKKEADIRKLGLLLDEPNETSDAWFRELMARDVAEAAFEVLRRNGECFMEKVMRMRYSPNEPTFREMAERLGMSETTVREAHDRAISCLRTEFSKEFLA